MPSVSNCLFWALKQKKRYGGRIFMVPSISYPGPHFQWENKSGELYEYVPVERRYFKYRPIPPILFVGYIKRVR